MKKNQGFIATSLLYTFFLFFCVILLSLVALFIHNRTLLNNLTVDIKTDLDNLTVKTLGCTRFELGTSRCIPAAQGFYFTFSPNAIRVNTTLTPELGREQIINIGTRWVVTHVARNDEGHATHVTAVSMDPLLIVPTYHSYNDEIRRLLGHVQIANTTIGTWLGTVAAPVIRPISRTDVEGWLVNISNELTLEHVLDTTYLGLDYVPAQEIPTVYPPNPLDNHDLPGFNRVFGGSFVVYDYNETEEPFNVPPAWPWLFRHTHSDSRTNEPDDEGEVEYPLAPYHALFLRIPPPGANRQLSIRVVMTLPVNRCVISGTGTEGNPLILGRLRQGVLPC